MPTCRSCPEPIFFARQNPTESNPSPASNPICATPQPNGNLRVDRRTMTYDVLTRAEVAAAQLAGEELYLSHFVNCPARQRFRKQAAGRN